MQLRTDLPTAAWQRSTSAVDLRPSRAWRVALAAALLLGSVGCGTTTVSMLVVRPALINAQPYGGTTSVAGVVASNPMQVPAANALRAEIEQAILAGHGGVVRLVQLGGGLAITGKIDQYGVAISTEEEDARCKLKTTVKVEQAQTETEQPETARPETAQADEQPADRPCKRYRSRWQARVIVTVRITSSQGQVVFYRQLVQAKDGVSGWQDEQVPTPPSQDQTLLQLRRAVADQIAWIVVPHQERVAAVLYDCEAPAEALCENGARQLAASNYQGALETYAQALEALRKRPGVPASELAEVHWNRAIVAKYGRMFDLAVQELKAAIQLDDSGTYRHELIEVQRAADDHNRLIDQGLGGN